jgi:hypothetical protein
MHFSKGLFLGVFFLLLSCVSHDIDMPEKCDSSDLVLHLDLIANASSCSAADGEIKVIAGGGQQPYFFQLNDLAFIDQNIFSGLRSGIYRVTVKDKYNCSASLLNLVLLADDFKFSVDVVEDTECINHNGSVTVNVQAGNAPFSYQFMDGDFTDNNVFDGLTAGNYSIAVKDACSCTAILDVSVLKGVANTSWANDILPIMNSSCAVSSCHDGKNRSDYRIYLNVKNNAKGVKSKTQDRSMPFDGPSLTQNQIDLIACWVNAGAPNN